MSCLGQSHFDPDYWEDPESFKPERFLTPEGKLNTKLRERILTFSIGKFSRLFGSMIDLSILGKRACPGEAISRMEVFLFCSAILQRFTIKKVDTPENKYDKASQPLFAVPTELQVIMMQRK